MSSRYAACRYVCMGHCNEQQQYQCNMAAASHSNRPIRHLRSITDTISRQHCPTSASLPSSPPSSAIRTRQCSFLSLSVGRSVRTAINHTTLAACMVSISQNHNLGTSLQQHQQQQPILSPANPSSSGLLFVPLQSSDIDSSLKTIYYVDH